MLRYSQRVNSAAAVLNDTSSQADVVLIKNNGLAGRDRSLRLLELNFDAPAGGCADIVVGRLQFNQARLVSLPIADFGGAAKRQGRRGNIDPGNLTGH